MAGSGMTCHRGRSNGRPLWVELGTSMAVARMAAVGAKASSDTQQRRFGSPPKAEIEAKALPPRAGRRLGFQISGVALS